MGEHSGQRALRQKPLPLRWLGLIALSGAFAWAADAAGQTEGGGK